MSQYDVLISGLNWVGDSIMAMPALQLFVERNPGVRVAMISKSSIAPLWRMHNGVDDVLELQPGMRGVVGAAREIGDWNCRTAYIWPHSFRSALVPFLARVPRRIGMSGHMRRALMTKIVPPCVQPDRTHQVFEYIDLMVPDWGGNTPPAPMLRISDAAKQRADDLLAEVRSQWIALMPGAAHGPSKRWPGESFVELGKQIRTKPGASIVVLGSPGEVDLCREVAHGIGEGAKTLAGHTTIDVLAGLLERCAAVVCNDSGGMHLGAAVGSPVVAIYGMTDPSKTGPLGTARIIQRAGKRSREIGADSKDARIRLASITPSEVYDEVLTFLRLQAE